MARTRAVISCALWNDPEWRRLTVGAQWLYLALLGRPTLSLCGLVVMQPKRWAQLAHGADVMPSLDELEEAGYVVTDDDTDEVLIRTFVANDVAKTSMPINTLKGLWSSWQAIESPNLRQVCVDGVPDEVWVKSAAYVPAEALEMRRPAPSEQPSERACERTSEQPSPHTSERTIELPASVTATDSVTDTASRRASERPSSHLAPLSPETVDLGRSRARELRGLTTVCGASQSATGAVALSVVANSDGVAR